MWGRYQGLQILVSDLKEVDQRRETGMKIIYFPEISLSWPHETCGSRGRVRCRKTAWTCQNRSA